MGQRFDLRAQRAVAGDEEPEPVVVARSGGGDTNEIQRGLLRFQTGDASHHDVLGSVAERLAHVAARVG